MRRTLPVFALATTLCFLTPGIAAAQDRGGVTTADLRVSTSELLLTLRPMTKPDLQIEAEAWMRVLQRTVTDLSRSQIVAGRLDGEERARRLAEAERKREERDQIITRLLVVLGELERKGGQADDIRTYIHAVQETDIGVVYSAAPGKPHLPRTTVNPNIGTAELALSLKPMTLPELVIEADGWQRLLQQSVAALSAHAIRAANEPELDQEPHAAEAAALRARQAALIERIKVVLDAVDAKGGKTDDYKTYVNAVAEPETGTKGGLVYPPIPKGPVPKTTDDPKISTGDLALMLTPLPKTQLIVEADGWLKLLEDTMQALAEAEIQASRAEGEQAEALRDLAGKKREERTQRIDRIKLVLDALALKGGDRAPYDAYINAVSGIVVKTDNTAAVVDATVAWLKSSEGGLRYAKNIALFLVTLMLTRVVTGVIGSLMSRAMASARGTSNLLKDFIIHTTRKVVFFVGFVIALSFLEVNIGPFLAAMGAVGFVIGFALQGTLSNFAAGVMILLYRPYDLHDTVTVAGVTGTVTAMTLVSTKVRNADGHEVVIPNSSIWGGTITNHGTAKSAK